MDWAFLQGVPEEDVRRLIAVGHHRDVVRKEPIVREGDPADVVYLIERGHFAVRLSQRGAGTATLAILGPGEVFGELALATQQATRSADVVALEEGRLLGIYRRELKPLRAKHPSIDRAVIAILAHQVRRLSESVFEAHYSDTGTKVRRRLVALAASYGDDSGAVEIPLDQATLGELSGTSRQEVNKVLREEEKRGAVELRRRLIVVKDVQGIAERAGIREP